MAATQPHLDTRFQLVKQKASKGACNTSSISTSSQNCFTTPFPESQIHPVGTACQGESHTLSGCKWVRLNCKRSFTQTWQSPGLAHQTTGQSASAPALVASHLRVRCASGVNQKPSERYRHSCSAHITRGHWRYLCSGRLTLAPFSLLLLFLVPCPQQELEQKCLGSLLQGAHYTAAAFSLRDTIMPRPVQLLLKRLKFLHCGSHANVSLKFPWAFSQWFGGFCDLNISWLCHEKFLPS